MPQFELDAVGPDHVSGRGRGRTAAEAVRRVAAVAEEVTVVVAEEADLHGWRIVNLDGQEAGRVRAHQRMQFRRD